jgi:hypothetical protein
MNTAACQIKETARPSIRTECPGPHARRPVLPTKTLISISSGVPAKPSPERLAGESARDFQAFTLYRDMVHRSLDGAWHLHRRNTQQDRESRGRPRLLDRDTHCPGHWTERSVKHNWVARAAEHDAQIDAAKRTVQLRRAAKLEDLRLDLEEHSLDLKKRRLDLEDHRLRYEVAGQIKLEERIEIVSALLEKASALPLETFLRQRIVRRGKRFIRKTTSAKGLSLSAFASLVHELLRLMRAATVGFRQPTARSPLFALA